MDAWITQLRKGVLEYCLLRLLKNQEDYPYKMVQRLKAIRILAITESTVYPILARMKNDRIVSVRILPSVVGPSRRYYALTRLGKERLGAMRSYWADLNQAIASL